MSETITFTALGETVAASQPAQLLEQMRTSEGTVREVAATALFTPVINRVERIAQAITPNTCAADETISGTMWRLAHSTAPGGAYKETGNWDGFVGTCTARAAKDAWRYNNQRPASSLDDLAEKGDAAVPAVRSAEEDAYALATRWRIEHAFTTAGVNAELAEVCIRLHVHGQTYAQIIKDMGLNTTREATRVNVSRALARMRKQYGDDPSATFDGQH